MDINATTLGWLAFWAASLTLSYVAGWMKKEVWLSKEFGALQERYAAAKKALSDLITDKNTLAEEREKRDRRIRSLHVELSAKTKEARIAKERFQELADHFGVSSFECDWGDTAMLEEQHA